MGLDDVIHKETRTAMADENPVLTVVYALEGAHRFRLPLLSSTSD